MTGAHGVDDTGAEPDPDATDRARLQLTVAGRPLVDASAVAGAVVWVALLLAARVDAAGALGTIDLFVALAVLVLVPLGLGLLGPADVAGLPRTGLRAATTVQFPAALAVVAALALPAGTTASVALALPWLAVCGGIAAVGAGRLLGRGPGPLPELAVDAALLYLPVGAVALVLHRAGVTFHFDAVIVLLTAVHYHYAGFVLPLAAGLLARRTTDADGRFGRGPANRTGAAALLVLVVNVALIAVGITFSPLVEVVAVALFTAAVAAFAALVLGRVVPAVPRLPAALLTVASLTLFGTMALALAYGYSAFPATGEVIDIGAMVRWHGTANAFGFALPALVALRVSQDRERSG